MEREGGLLTTRGRRRKSRWILASASPRRREILGRLGLKFEVSPSRIMEPPRNPHETPARYAVRVARMKARKAADGRSCGLVLGADTIVVLGNRILGKPSSRAEARAMLQSLGGRWHEVISGLCLLDCATRRALTASSCSRVHFRRLSPSEIDWYVRTGEYRDKAGAYGIQGCASLFIDRIEGCYFNIVGFPVAAFDRLCRRMRFNLWSELICQTHESP